MGKVLVVGGGAGGMMAAIFAHRAGAAVTVLEANEKLGKKLYITGKGRCNVTNDCTTEEFLSQVPRNSRFLYSALAHFSPQDMMALLTEAGCPVEVQRGRRVFPVSQRSSDVIRTLTRMLAGAEIRLHTQVSALWLEAGKLRGVITAQGERVTGDRVILAAGGLSYPMTGSTGIGYELAKSAGHTIVPPAPALSAMETEPGWSRMLQGLSLKNIRLTLSAGKKVRYTELGEMLFTHFGISGPLVLEMSSHLPDPKDLTGLCCTLNLKPGLTRAQLDARLLREAEENGLRQLTTVLDTLLPARLAALFPGLCGLDGTKKFRQLTLAERGRIAEMLQALPLPLSRLRPVAEAIVTRGGVSVKEVNPATMESKMVPGLYLAGEMLDLDAHTGGYNLQIAFSTGALAGACAAACEGRTKEW